MVDRVGQQLGNYTLVRFIGDGGFAEVYLGEHRYLKSQAALKVLKTALREEEVELFLAEAQTLVNLKHPNIVHVLDFAVEQGVPVLIMDYAPAGTLRAIHPKETHLSLEQVVLYVKQIAAALQYAHNHNIIHRDVKPENVLFGPEQRLLLSDFGLALLVRPADLLSTQNLAGTLPYTAPEQLRGKPCFASDQYALGVVVYEWLCGRRPFEGSIWQLINQQQWAAPPPLSDFRPDLPTEVEEVVLRAMAKDHRQRFVSIQAFALALESVSRKYQADDEDDDAEITVSLKLLKEPQGTIPASYKRLEPSTHPEIFLSASSGDVVFAARLRADLAERGIRVWVNQPKNTVRGSGAEDGEWEAIRAAPFVLLVLTPCTRFSHTVAEHMRVANQYERRLVFVIAEGGEVADMLPIPETWGKTSVIRLIDAREMEYYLALTKIHKLLDNEEDVTTIVVPPYGALAPPGSEVYENRNESSLATPDDQESYATIPLSLTAPARTELPPLPAQYTNRQRLLAKVRAFWITGVLEQSLHGAALLALGLYEQQNAVANPWDMVLQQPETNARLLPAGMRITQVYDNAGGELLILGGPGSGKTTLLLELARDLLTRAAQDETHPIPVIFNLSSWSVKRQSLSDWLIEELRSKYQVPPRLGRSWAEADGVLPLLDGLDEMPQEGREECLDAINAYHQRHGLLPIVVCSRSDDYLALATRALLRSAVIVQPLSGRQINEYIANAGDELEAVRVTLNQDATMRELATTPLMLSVLTLAYQGQRASDVLATGTLETRRQQVFAYYVQRMLERRGTKVRYTPQKTVKWLALLARQLTRHSQTEFYLEQMQPDWLPGHLSSWLYNAVAVSPIDALIGIVVGVLIGTLHSSHVGALVYGLVGLLVVLLARRRKLTIQPGKIATSWLKLISVWSMCVGVILELVIGLSYLVVNSVSIRLDDVLVNLVVGALIGLVIGALMSVRKKDIQPVEIVIWSWRRFFKMKHIRNGILAGLVFGIINAFIFLPSGPFFGFFGALAGWLLSALLDGLSSDMLDSRRRVVPNQGIHRSARNGLLIGLIATLATGLIIGMSLTLGYTLFIGPVQGLAYGVVRGLIYGLGIGLLAWLFGGGDACIKHLVLRLLLTAMGSLPWNYSRFLDYAAEHLLLRKVGGGYIFIHDLFREYLAALEPKVPAAQAVSQEEPVKLVERAH